MRRATDENGLLAQIERIFRSKKLRALTVGMGDDAALWSPARGKQTILTCDWFLEGTHFLRDKHPPDSVGWKSLVRATSDIAAMGGVPRCFLLSLALPRELTGSWLDNFLKGIRRASYEFGCELAGGDTTRQEKVLISITVVGEIGRGQAVLRSGARPGDAIFVSGTLGQADFGLEALRKHGGLANATTAALKKHLYPKPRLALGQFLQAQWLATAMMDISDGLSTDLPRLCAASRVGATIDAVSLPAVKSGDAEKARYLALHGGDDYELLFTVRSRKVPYVPGTFRGLRLTRIGTITHSRKTLVAAEDRRVGPLAPGGWDPFR